MTKRNVGGVLLALSISITAAIASCSFPTYEINVTGTVGSTGDASATASSSTAGGGGNGGAGSASTSTTSSGAGGSGGAGGSSTSSTSSASSTSSGPCSTDADGDTYISAKCPGGNDCADNDVLANPKGDYQAFPIEKPPVGTLPFDFNCNGSQETETPALNCGACAQGEGFQAAVACGASAPIGTCTGVILCSFTPKNPAISKTQRCK